MPNPAFSILSTPPENRKLNALLNRSSDLDISEGALVSYFEGGGPRKACSSSQDGPNTFHQSHRL